MTQESKILNGQCLCGAVTVTASVTDPIICACHCDMCRRHTSAMLMSLPSKDILVEEPAKAFQSSEWAEREFCKV